MSAIEIISEIKKLPTAEQEQVLAFLQKLHGERQGNPADVRYVNDVDFDKAAEKVLRERADLLRRLAQ